MPTSFQRNTALLDPQVLKILRCPLTSSALVQRGAELVAVTDESIRYPIQYGVPKLLPDFA